MPRQIFSTAIITLLFAACEIGPIPLSDGISIQELERDAFSNVDFGDLRHAQGHPVGALKDSTHGTWVPFVLNQLVVTVDAGLETQVLTRLNEVLLTFGFSGATSLAREDLTWLDGSAEKRTLVVSWDPPALPQIPAALTEFLPDLGPWLESGQILALSSLEAASTLAAASRLINAGFAVSPNFVTALQTPTPGYFKASIEHSRSDPTHAALTQIDAMDEIAFSCTEGTQTCVSGMWQFLFERGFTPEKAHRGRPLKLAILDDGFWLQPNGRANLGASALLSDPTSDLPEHPEQFDFSRGVPNAAAASASRCSGNTPCPWHGNGTASIATAYLNNQYGAAGTGGLVAEPLLYRMGASYFHQAWAIRKAQGAGVSVLSMSFGSPTCKFAICKRFLEIGGYLQAFRDAHARGLVIVAAAGNGTTKAPAADVEEQAIRPCTNPGVICVGALDKSSKRLASGYSFFGAGVKIWAPSNIPVMPDGDSNNSTYSFGGTSFGTVCCGVVAP